MNKASKEIIAHAEKLCRKYKNKFKDFDGTLSLDEAVAVILILNMNGMIGDGFNYGLSDDEIYEAITS